MKGKAKRSPAEGDFLFEIDPQPLEECVTALGGVPLLVRAIRSLDVPGSVQRHLRVKQRERGFDEATYIERFLVLNAVGGDCLEDFEPLREDAGLAEMLGHEMPSAVAARKFLYQFHDEAKIEQAQRELPSGRVSYIPGESAPLRGLEPVNEDVIQELGRRCPEQKIATLDLDATLIESWKREASIGFGTHRRGSLLRSARYPSAPRHSSFLRMVRRPDGEQRRLRRHGLSRPSPGLREGRR